jgi:hypothetical protein
VEQARSFAEQSPVVRGGVDSRGYLRFLVGVSSVSARCEKRRCGPTQGARKALEVMISLQIAKSRTRGTGRLRKFSTRPGWIAVGILAALVLPLAADCDYPQLRSDTRCVEARPPPYRSVTPPVRTCTPDAQHRHTPGVHVYTRRATASHPRCARVHPTRNTDTPQVCTCTPDAQQRHTPGVHVYTRRATASHPRCARVHPTRNTDTPQVCTCTPDAQQRHTPGVHVYTRRATASHPRCARVHPTRNSVTPPVCTCTPDAQHRHTPGAHVHADAQQRYTRVRIHVGP